MNLDLPSLIIGILALATFCVPIAWYQISEKMKEKKLNDDLMQFAQQENLSLTIKETWGDHFALGIDKNCKKLVYLKQDENGDQKELIDLSEVQKCKVANGTKSVRNANGNRSVLNSIKLQFHYFDSNKKASSLEVYNNSNGRTLTYELSIANKLARNIRPLLTKSEKSYRLPSN